MTTINIIKNNKVYKLSTNRIYLLRKHEGYKDEEQFLVSLKLMKYDDGEGYGTETHYGYMFVIKEIIMKYYNYRVGDNAGTASDLCDRVVIYKR